MQKRGRNVRGHEVRWHTHDTPNRPLSRHAALSAFDGVGMVYAARVGQVVKFGHTEDIAGRLRTLAYYNGEQVEILAMRPGTRDDEADIHASLAPHLSRGREYYSPAAEVLALVNDMREDLGLAPI